MTALWDRVLPQLRDIEVYEPGKPIEETARELGVDPGAIIKLASNENPLGPSPQAVAAVTRAAVEAQLYPDGPGQYLREALARSLTVTREHIILGNGSNEIIEFLGHVFLSRGDEIIVSQFGFIAYRIVATLFGATVVETPSRNYSHDLDAMLAAITPRTKLVFIANPNNPTGTLLGQSNIDNFIARVPRDIIVAIDEAYFELLDDPPDVLRYVRDGRNVVVLRTFSKIHGLASLRVGYGIAPPELIAILHRTRQPFNVSGVGQAAALAALEDAAHQRETKRVIDAGRAYLHEQFTRLRLRFIPAVANFVMVNVGDGAAVFNKMLARKIIVRPLKGYGLPEWLRISVGTMEQNKRCIAALKEAVS